MKVGNGSSKGRRRVGSKQRRALRNRKNGFRVRRAGKSVSKTPKKLRK
jgi:hypothetical protein